jgi:hypothetical protein
MSEYSEEAVLKAYLTISKSRDAESAKKNRGKKGS